MKKFVFALLALVLSPNLMAVEKKLVCTEAYEGIERFEIRFDLENSTRVKIIYPKVGYIGIYQGVEKTVSNGQPRKMHVVDTFSFWNPSTGNSRGMVPTEFVLKANEDFSRVFIRCNGEKSYFFCKVSP